MLSKKYIEISIKNFYVKPNLNALWVFGFQRSGTTAIAALISEMTNKDVQLDIPILWEPYRSKIIKNELDLWKWVKKNSYYFSKDILKEPNAAIFFEKVDSIFKLNKFILIVRNPLDSIRSILNRKGIDGNLSNFDINNWPRYHLRYGNNLDVIGNFAREWVNVYSKKDMVDSSRCIIVKYEDFINNKERFIGDLVHKLNLEQYNSISDIADYQFQPKGKRETDLLSFYGKDNYEKILSICENTMTKYGY